MQIENKTPFDVQFVLAFGVSGREQIVMVVKGTYDFPAGIGHIAPLSEAQKPIFDADVLGDNPEKNAAVFETDLSWFKPKADVLVHGPAIAPGGRPATSVNVGVRVGAWSKSMTITGQRIWLKSGIGSRISDPRPFAMLPISYDSAWGGVDVHPKEKTRIATFEDNPVGVGFYPYRTEIETAPLPTSSVLGSKITDREGSHRPMAFGPIGRAWLPRRKYAGTYDDAWLDHRMPLMPKDFDMRFFQAAAEDQQIPYPKGGEPIELLNLTNEGRFGMLMPQEKITATFHRKRGPVSQKVLNMDTILLLSAERKLCLTWRTRFSLDRDLHDLDEIIVQRTQLQ